MIPSIRFVLVSCSALTLASCSWFNKGSQGSYDTQPAAGGYDTSNPYGNPGSAAAPPAGNATYSKAAYEESSTAPVAESAPATPAPSHVAPAKTTVATGAPKHAAAAPASTGSGEAKVHVVAKGDTLWGIGRKYGVSVDAIKKANGLTKDTVVLGAKLKIPAH